MQRYYGENIDTFHKFLRRKGQFAPPPPSHTIWVDYAKLKVRIFGSGSRLNGL